MSILITGLTGFLGTHLVRELRKRYPKREISALVLPHEKDLCEKYTEYNVNFIYGNIISKDSLEGCLEGIESVFHLAAIVDDLAPPSLIYEVNYQGTKNLLEEFVKANSKKFIYMSTLGIYGFNLPNYPIDEDYKVDLIPGYRESKYLSEKEISYLKKQAEKGETTQAISGWPYPRFYHLADKSKNVLLVHRYRSHHHKWPSGQVH